MNKDKLNELLDSIYELEGLVHLALTRDDNPEHLPELITKKGCQLAKFADEVSKSTGEDKVETPHIDVISGFAHVRLDNEEVIPSESLVEDGMPDKDVVNVIPDNPEPMIEELLIEPVPMIEEDIQTVVDTVFDSLPDTDSVADPEPLHKSDLSPETKPIAEANPVVETEPVAPTEKSFRREPRGKLVFSINDRYRFKRELFGNSDADFNTTLALVASMDGYEEAEDFFLGEMNWDQKREEVVEFLEIIKKYFK